VLGIDSVKVGDLVKHEYDHPGYGRGIVLKIDRSGPPGSPIYVHAMFDGWRGLCSIEKQYLEVVSEGG